MNRFVEESFQIERSRMHRQLAVGRARPLFLRPIPVELDAVVIRVPQVERFADAVIGRAVERDAGVDQPAHRISQRGAGRIQDGKVIQAGRPRRRWVATGAFPGVQPDVVMIVATGNERRAAAVPPRELEAQHATVEPERTMGGGNPDSALTDTYAW